ncbi:hypothetical protein DRN50_06380 [Thermococci archaeon]|nr:MAG: hypothetical protein DRN50_06380 [Thermococci archaeon]
MKKGNGSPKKKQDYLKKESVLSQRKIKLFKRKRVLLKKTYKDKTPIKYYEKFDEIYLWFNFDFVHIFRSCEQFMGKSVAGRWRVRRCNFLLWRYSLFLLPGGKRL